ncbi:MAG TPA: sigma-70 family RNA polymerase sigma factor [Pseudonocardiaceae bacterium]|nr:sigma-70 family RNA polymerase sigma factor [Pseudonocardiaceae bacterium]
MDEHEWLAQRFEEQRPHLKSMAYRMLGSATEADDAVQDAWIRLNRTGSEGIENLGGWLTTVVARVCLNMLRARQTRREDAGGVHLPDLVIDKEGPTDPEQEALLADSVGLALVIVLDTLSPAERLAFVLHDMFDLPFDEIATMIDKSPAAARQLTSRARRRVREGGPAPDPDVRAQRRVVDAFFAAARRGDFEALVEVLNPDAVMRVDGGLARPEASAVVRGAELIAQRAMMFAQPAAELRPARVNGSAGVIVTVDGRPVSAMAFLVAGGRIAGIDSMVDPDRLAALDLSVLDA